MKFQVLVSLILCAVLAAATSAATSPAGSVGRGHGVAQPARSNPCGGVLSMHYDGSAENGYCWQYGGVMPPYYGAFAECYEYNGGVCGIELMLTSVGSPTHTLDAYVWSDDGGAPGNVLSMTSGINPGTVAVWPNVSTHDFAINPANVTGTFWIGYWADFSAAPCGYYIAADLDGPSGCPLTNIAPGIGYPTGWSRVDQVWDAAQSLGIGVWYGWGHEITGACCEPNGTCHQTKAFECQYQYLGNNTYCSPNPCNQPFGACCYADGACLVTTLADCPAANWIMNETCAPDPCPPLPAGACCLDGVCNITTAPGCGGLWLGQNSVCDPGACPAPSPDHPECTNYRDYFRLITSVGGGNGTFLGVTGNSACVGGYDPLTVYDVSDPQHPRLSGRVSIGNHPVQSGLCVANGLAYLTTMDGDMYCTSGAIWVVDVSDPWNPQLVNTVGTGGCADSEVLAGDRLYVTTEGPYGGGGFEIFDLANPRAPAMLGSISLPTYTYGVTVIGTIAYVIDGASQLWPIDVSVPESPVILGKLDLPGEGRSVSGWGTHVYVSTIFAGLQVVDVSDPANPRIVDAVSIGTLSNLALSGDFAFSTSLEAVDISNPAHLKVVGRACGWGGQVVVAGNRAYVGANGLEVLDISNPRSPAMLGAVHTPDTAIGVASAGSYAYVGAGTAGLQVIDISSPANPVIVGSQAVVGSAGAVALMGNLACVTFSGGTSPSSGCEFVDISDPRHPVDRGSVATSGTAWCVAAADGYAYVGDHEVWAGHLLVVDLRDPLHPQTVAVLPTQGAVSGVAVSGHLLCLTEDSSRDHKAVFQVFDVTDPAAPALVGSWESQSWNGGGVLISGSTAFAQFYYLYAFDISDPANPHPIASTFGGQGLALSGHELYQPSGNILTVCDVSDPQDLRMTGNAGVGGNAVAAAAGCLCLAAGSSGLVLAPMQCEPAGVDDSPGVRPQLAVRAWPNPASRAVSIECDLPASGLVRVAIVDVAGRVVRALDLGYVTAGHRDLRWDGRDDRGRLVPAGIYLARASTASGVKVARVVVVRE